MAGGLQGCAPTAEVAAPARPQTVVTKQHAAISPASKGNITRLGEGYQLDVIGLDQNEIQSRLGHPIEDLQHLPAVEAVFSAGRCTLNVTLYPDVQTHIYHALAYKVASDVDTAKERRRCAAAFAARLHGKPADSTADTDGPG